MKRILPCYPLLLNDPMFSLWSCQEHLNEDEVVTWYGEKKKLYGFARVDQVTYCFMGKADRFVPMGVRKAEQVDLKVTAFTTEYTFRLGKAQLNVRFVSPLTPDNLELLAMPTAYMEYEVTGAEQAEVAMFVNRNIAYNDRPRISDEYTTVRGLKIPCAGYEAAAMGLKRQQILSADCDRSGADWGWWYITGEQAEFADEKDMFSWLLSGNRAFTADTGEHYICSLNRSAAGAIVLAFDDVVSINYFGEILKGYYLRNHTIFEAMDHTLRHREQINGELDAFARKLHERAEKYGDAYESVLIASLRQSVAGHKLVLDGEGNLVFLSKECNSNGCIGTVDISYPSMPLFLLYDTELVKGMMRPILKFARMPVWKYDFAPHDVGVYPSCLGQAYGLDSNLRSTYKMVNSLLETNYPIYLLPDTVDVFKYEKQMPVEECANMLIMFLACQRFDGDTTFFRDNLLLCEKWVEYLVRYGLKPENQLCTDDFAGHLKNNVNLAIKATVGIAAYAELVKLCGDGAGYKKYRTVAEKYAAEITAFGAQFTHLPLTWDSGEETFSLKYNFAFDKILELGLFSQELFENEVSYYLTKCNPFGVPLDSRADYTKSDWLVWTAALTDVAEKKQALIRTIHTFLTESPDREAFGDWYYTTGGKKRSFRARTVQAGCFALLLQDALRGK